MHHGFEGMGWGWYIAFLILILIIWLVVKTANRANQNKPGKKSVLDILKERYARGEIDKEEFEEKKNSIL